jgi:hypothetical protein
MGKLPRLTSKFLKRLSGIEKYFVLTVRSAVIKKDTKFFYRRNIKRIVKAFGMDEELIKRIRDIYYERYYNK